MTNGIASPRRGTWAFVRSASHRLETCAGDAVAVRAASRIMRRFCFAAMAVGAVLLAVPSVQARDSWFEEACEEAGRQGRTWIEVQRGNEVVVVDCTGEVIIIEDEGDPFPGSPGGSTPPGGGNDTGPDDDVPGGPGGSIDECAQCRSAANECRSAAHHFRYVCNNAGRQFAHQTCAGWGPSSPQHCDGSDWESDVLLEVPREDWGKNQCHLINIDGDLQPVEREICSGPIIDFCVKECMHGRPGRSSTFTLSAPVVGGPGMETTVEISSTQGITQGCAAASQSQALSCAARESQCLSDNKCGLYNFRMPSVAPAGTDTVTKGKPAATPPGMVSSSGTPTGSVAQTAPAESGPPEGNVDTVTSNKAAARQWYGSFVRKAALDEDEEKKVTMLIGRATRRYLQLYHAQTPGKAPLQGAASGALQPKASSGATAKKAPDATRATGSMVRGYKLELPTASDVMTDNAPDPGRRFQDAKLLPEVDEIFLQKVFAFLSGRQEKILIDTWPGGQLIFGSAFIRAR